MKAKVTSTARANVTTTASAPSLPELRQRALTTSTDVSARTRRGSISSHVSSATGPAPSRNIYSPPRLAPTSSNEENNSGSSSVVSGSGVGPIKVRSKVTKLAEHSAPTSPSMPSSPSFPPHTRPTRVPSVSSLSLSPPLGPTKSSRSNGISPVSTSGHARYATTREIASPKANPFRAFAPVDDSAVSYSSSGPRIDPSQIPLPPQSPQMSAVSFSSKSSVSCESRNSDSSGQTAPTSHLRLNGHVQVNIAKHARSRSSIDGLGIHHPPLPSPLPLSREPSRDSPSPVLASENDDRDILDEVDVISEDDDRKLRKEAISNRKVCMYASLSQTTDLEGLPKIADLEITNKSLLAINSSLEAAKNRQAKEIRELRRKLRESILVLPPSAYRVVKDSLAPEDAEEPEPEDEDVEEEEAVLDDKTDEAYRRVRSMLEALIESGRKALETRPEDFKEPGIGITKVLTEEEARTWRGDDVSLTERDLTDDSATEDDPSRPLTPSRVAIPSDDFSSEEEVELSLIIDDDSLRSSSVPPITVTPSPSP